MAHLIAHAGTGEPGTETAGVAQILAVFLLADDTIIVLHDHVIGHLAPAFHHLISHLAAIIGQVADGRLAVGLHQLEGTFLHLGLTIEITGLQRVAHLLQFGIEQAPSRINHIAHPVAHPVGTLITEGIGIGLLIVIAMRHT